MYSDENLNFKTDEEKLRTLFHRYDPIEVQISRRLQLNVYF